MYKLDLPVDYKETAVISKRRALEEERKNRIFNAKYRTIGLDLEAIDQQVKDRREQETKERLRSEAFDSDRVKQDQIAEILGKRFDEERRQVNRAENEFRALHQQPSDRREWDLYDPEYLKKDQPARVSDDDPRCGPASLQKFEGEDLNAKAREKFQQEQLREWTNQQKKMKDIELSAKKRANDLYETKMKELDARAVDLQNAEEECRRAINLATHDYNEALAKEAYEKKRLAEQQEADDNATEIANHIFGDILTENPSQASSLFGPHRVITDRWKGMSPEQLEEIRRSQEAQRLEKQRLRDEENKLNQEWDRQLMIKDRVANLRDREQERSRREKDREMAENNLRLAEQQKNHLDHLTKEVYTNPPTAAYFMQWNTTSR